MYGAVMQEKRKIVNSVGLSENRTPVRKNRTGIPAQLKERMERNTGLSFDDVRVHYNSALPARLDALAYTQGNQVEIGPGQERHLPHELGHVVQQKLGAVRANATHSSGVALNTDPALEHQADEIGAGKKLAIVQRMRNNNIIQRCGDPEDSPKEEEKEDESQKQESQEQSPSSGSTGTDAKVDEGGIGVLDDANYAQRTYSNTFSAEGRRKYSELAGESINTIDDLVNAIKEGKVDVADLPVEYIVRGRNTLILNTRTSQALTQAGIPRSQWKAVNRTGNDLFERLLTGQLSRNGLSSEGISTVRLSGGQ